MKNERGLVSMRFVTSGKKILQLVAKPEFERVRPGFESENVRMAQRATFLRLLLCVPRPLSRLEDYDMTLNKGDTHPAVQTYIRSPDGILKTKG